MGAELKRGKAKNDPYDDVPTHDPDTDVLTRKAVRGQVMSYNEHNFAYQHRTAMYHLFINGECFRAMRWDRSGVIVTEAINYVRSPAGTKALLETCTRSRGSRSKRRATTWLSSSPEELVRAAAHR